ncbi:Uncharacterised protein [Streptococcus pneumoniae]|nr:Uncharacterised protein [Streptococcus pneumoniae]
MNKKISQLMYALTKHASNQDWEEFLEAWGFTIDEYQQIEKYLKRNYGVTTYFNYNKEEEQ